MNFARPLRIIGKSWLAVGLALAVAGPFGSDRGLAQIPPPALTTLHGFTGADNGAYPYAGLIADLSGALRHDIRRRLE